MSANQKIAQYELRRRIGEGGMGVVYEALDVQLQRPAALKLMHDEVANNEEFRGRFLQEARSVAALEHPNIIRIYSSAVDPQGRYYLVMEYMHGGSLRDCLTWLASQRKYLDLSEALVLAQQVAVALDYANRHQIVHRDIKPDNVLLKPAPITGGPRFLALLTDFGLAKLIDAQSLVKTQVNKPLGTLAYMAPEQFRGQVDHRSDLYALGVMLYELVVGQLPFTPQTLPQALQMHTQQQAAPPSSIRQGLLPQVDGLILRALEKSQDRRYQSGQEFAQAIQNALAGGPLLAPQAQQSAYIASIEHYLATRIPNGQAAPIQVNPVADSSPAPVTQPRGVAAQVPVTTNDTIIISRDGFAPRSVTVTKSTLMIGRDPNHEVALAGDKVSRNHARIDYRPDGSYTITDLGSSNGTYINTAKLIKDVPEHWPLDLSVGVGEYRLSLQRTAAQAAASNPSADPKKTQVSAPPPPAGRKQAMRSVVFDLNSPSGYDENVGSPRKYQTESATDPQQQLQQITQGVVVNLSPTVIEVEPGLHADSQVQIYNGSKIVKHCRIVVVGVYPEWVTEPRSTLNLLPDDKGELPIIFHPPRDSASKAGKHPIQIQVVDEEKRVIGQGDALLVVRPYHNFSTDMTPKLIRRSGLLQVTVSNEGNDFTSYTLAGRDREHGLLFFPPEENFTLPPGSHKTFEFEVRPARRMLIGQTVRFQFEMPTIAKGGETRIQNGELVSPPLIPVWLLPLLMFLCVGLILLLLLLWQNRKEDEGDSLVNVPTETATAAATFDISTPRSLLTATAVTYFSTVTVGETATADALMNSDLDNDGLTYAEELAFNTDPNNPDTDNDGLSDGEEKELGTDPNKADTDGDGLKDGEEVKEHRTDPKNKDTDNDGLTDFEEITLRRQGILVDPNKDDTDGDGIKDGIEVNELNTRPDKFDTDGDGANDGIDTAPNDAGAR